MSNNRYFQVVNAKFWIDVFKYFLQAAKEEVDNLLDKTANGSPEVTETVTPEAEATVTPGMATR